MCELHDFAISFASGAAQCIQEDFSRTKEGDADACSSKTCTLILLSLAQCLPADQLIPVTWILARKGVPT